MRTCTRHLVALTVVALIGALGVSPAAGNRSLEVEPSGVVRGVLLEGQQLFIAFGRLRIRCRSTLTATMNARWAKVRDAFTGRITEVAIGGCTTTETGTITVRALGLPWNLTYMGFGGTLPNITEVRLSIPNAQFLSVYTLFGMTIRCLFQGTTPVLAETPGATAVDILINNVGLTLLREAELVDPECGTERAFLTAVFELQPNLRVRLL